MLFAENILGGIGSTIIKTAGNLLSFLPLLLNPRSPPPPSPQKKKKKTQKNPAPPVTNIQISTSLKWS